MSTAAQAKRKVANQETSYIQDSEGEAALCDWNTQDVCGRVSVGFGGLLWAVWESGANSNQP